MPTLRYSRKAQVSRDAERSGAERVLSGDSFNYRKYFVAAEKILCKLRELLIPQAHFELDTERDRLGSSLQKEVYALAHEG